MTRYLTQLRFLNRAALKTQGDTNSDSSIAKLWRLCSVQQVEELKSLITILPIMSTGIFLSTPIAILMSPSFYQGPPCRTTFQNTSRVRDSLFTIIHRHLYHPQRPHPLFHVAEAVSSVSYTPPMNRTQPCVQRIRHGCGSFNRV